MIYTRNEVQLTQPNTLICLVTGFYPAPVNVSWSKNGEKVTVGTSINVPYPNNQGTFTQISRLDFVPEQGDIYICRVQHPAMSEADTRMWSETTLFKLRPQQRRTNVPTRRQGHVCVNVCVCMFAAVKVKQPGVGPAVFCGLGLTFGLLGVAAGTFFLIKGNECR